MRTESRDRCDRCKKWISSRHQTGVYTLEGLVPAGMDFSFCICERCIEAVAADQWKGWVEQQKTASSCTVRRSSEGKR